jgi:DNA-binding transcriptional ArsR family regulator
MAAADASAAGDPFEALGDPNRRAILRLLSEGDRAVQAIAAELPISRPAVSRHLRLLKDAGLVAEHAAGTRRIYRLRDEGLRAVQEYLEGVWGEAAARFRLLAENTAPAAVPEPRQPVPQPGPAAVDSGPVTGP